ncbi:MAG: alpha/beta hydrolase-fold protein [Kiritimatiellae bacterium]|nr:alpha/beta hydrolase-fold protein [Kiritimatiellia bacterium]
MWGDDEWVGQVAVRAGATNIEYRFISRLDAAALYCSVTNVEWLGDGNMATSTPPQEAAPYTGKTLYYLSSWTSAFVNVVDEGSNSVPVELDRVGEGRAPGEFLYRGANVGEEGEPLQFCFSGYLSETQYWDRAPYGGYGSNDYYTSLDVFYVQDGNVFSYRPPPAPAAPKVVTQTVASTVSGIVGRMVRTYLPRGYADNTWKQYPVIYMHDGGQVVGAWGAWHTLTREIGQGRMREAIVVAVNAMNRCAEYTPPGETIPPDVGCGSNEVSGVGDRYADYLINDVKGYVDASYRTLSDPANSGVMGALRSAG